MPESPHTHIQGRRATAAAAGALALAALGGCASDPASAGADWRSHHPVDRTLIRGVSWPGTSTRRVEESAHGFRIVLKFPGDDSDMGAIVQVAPNGTDPCTAMPYLISDTGTHHPDPSTYGDTGFARATCTPAGKDAWTLTQEPVNADSFSGYAVRRDGVVLVLSTYDTWTDPDFPSIAASLQRLDDRRLGSLL